MSRTPLYSNILVRVPNWLGDTMMATPTVSAIRKAFPKTKLTLLCKPQYVEFWSDLPGVDQVIPVEKGFLGFWNTASVLQKKKFDASLTLPNSFSSAFLLFAAGIPHRAGWGGEGRDLFLTQVVPHEGSRQKHLVWEFLELAKRGLGEKLTAKTYQLSAPVKKSSKDELAKLLKKEGASTRQGLIALGAGATYGPAKRWPLPYWKEVIAQLLKTRKETLVVIGGKEEQEYLSELFAETNPRLVSMVGKTSPQVLAALLEEAKLLVTNDTGPMHVAAAVSTPTVALFGSTSPEWTRPFGLGHEVLYKHQECSPCFQKTCPIGYICLHRITVEEVVAAVQKKLKGPSSVQGEKVPQGVLL